MSGLLEGDGVPELVHVEVLPVEDQPTGIYSECALCGAVVALTGVHEAWHVSRGEETV